MRVITPFLLLSVVVSSTLANFLGTTLYIHIRLGVGDDNAVRKIDVSQRHLSSPADIRVPEQTDDVDDEHAMSRRNELEVGELNGRPDAVAHLHHRSHVPLQLGPDVRQPVAPQSAHHAHEHHQVERHEESLIGEHLPHGSRDPASLHNPVERAVPDVHRRTGEQQADAEEPRRSHHVVVARRAPSLEYQLRDDVTGSHENGRVDGDGAARVAVEDRQVGAPATMDRSGEGSSHNQSHRIAHLSQVCIHLSQVCLCVVPQALTTSGRYRPLSHPLLQ